MKPVVAATVGQHVAQKVCRKVFVWGFLCNTALPRVPRAVGNDTAERVLQWRFWEIMVGVGDSAGRT